MVIVSLWAASCAMREQPPSETPTWSVPGPPASAPATTASGTGAPLYTQHADVDGFTIEASGQVSPFALAEANWLVRRMIPPEDIRALAGSPIRFVVLGTSEMLTDLPEYVSLLPRVWWDHRFRGIGPGEVPVVACGEENLLDLPGDPHPRDSSCVHELGHAVARARALLDPTFVERLHSAYTGAMASGLWHDDYASQDAAEYFAVGTQAWFDTLSSSSNNTSVDSRPSLRAYDPALAGLCQEVFGDGAWRYQKPWVRPETERAHLVGFDRVHAVPFIWPLRARLDIAATALPWQAQPPGKSPATTDRSWTIFRNERSEEVSADWVDHEGVRRPWFTLRPGEEKLQDTYVGHVWYLRNGTADFGAIVAAPGVGYVNTNRTWPAPADWRRRWETPEFRLAWAPGPLPTSSPDGGDSTWLVFANHSQGAVTVDWLDHQGTRRTWFTLQPGDDKLQDVYAGHVWFVSDGHHDLGAAVVPARVGYIEVE
jgi:hypothetical protein